MLRIVQYDCQVVTAAMLLLLTIGCEPGTEALAPVRGKVSYKGTPLSTGTIVFTPDTLRGTSGPMARAEIQPDGTYVLRSKGLPGAPAGWYCVTVMAMDTPPALGQGEQFIIPRSLLPEKYRDPELSGLSCEIRGDRENSIDFNLE